MSNFDRATFRCEADKVLADFSDEQLGELRAAIDTAILKRAKARDDQERTAQRILEEYFGSWDVPVERKLFVPLVIQGGKR